MVGGLATVVLAMALGWNVILVALPFLFIVAIVGTGLGMLGSLGLWSDIAKYVYAERGWMRRQQRQVRIMETLLADILWRGCGRPTRDRDAPESIATATTAELEAAVQNHISLVRGERFYASAISAGRWTWVSGGLAGPPLLIWYQTDPEAGAGVLAALIIAIAIGVAGLVWALAMREPLERSIVELQRGFSDRDGSRLRWMFQREMLKDMTWPWRMR